MTRLGRWRSEGSSYRSLCKSNNLDLHGDRINEFSREHAAKQRLQGAGNSHDNADTNSVAESVTERDSDAGARAGALSNSDCDALE
jgi:hypothetical protein